MIIQAICEWAGPRNSLFTFGLECMEPFVPIGFDPEEQKMYKTLRKRYQTRSIKEKFSLFAMKTVFRKGALELSWTNRTSN